MTLTSSAYAKSRKVDEEHRSSMIRQNSLVALSCQPPRPMALTQRESEVAAMVAEGATNQQVSLKLWVSQKTVEMHLSNVYRKLGIQRRQLAVLYAAAASRDVRNRCDDGQG